MSRFGVTRNSTRGELLRHPGARLTRQRAGHESAVGVREIFRNGSNFDQE
jgi:hypothetical protein